MLNEQPIFVNGFSRGGTTILTNLLASHPDVCTLGETHHVFKGTSISDSVWNVLRKCFRNDAPVIVHQRQNFFSPRLIKARKPLLPNTAKLIDEILYREKLRSRHPLLNQFKGPDQLYTRDEIRESRLLCKNIDGMIYANDAWAQMYPRARFFALVRNGLALCEGHLRRGRSAAEIGWRYQVLVDKMLRDAESMANYTMIRFEDLIAAPRETMIAACHHAQLDDTAVTHVRMQARRVMDADGNHRLVGRHAEWEIAWLDVGQLDAYFQRDVDKNQIKRLSSADRDAFMKQAGSAMQRLGYDDESLATGDRPEHRFLVPFQRQRSGEGNPKRRAA